MQTDITPLLNHLAEKLGTTIGHLWVVLIRQAYITAAIDLIQYAVIAYALHRLIAFTRLYLRRSELNLSFDEGTPTLLFAAWCVLGFMAIIAFFSFPDAASALLNPEYWALEKVLSAVNGS